MTFAVDFGETVVIRHRTTTGTDSYGNDTYTWTDEAIDNVPVWESDANAAGGNERVQARDMVLAGMTISLPYGHTITAVDRVQVRGRTYEVTGKPVDWRSPQTGVEAGTIVTLSLVTG